MPRESDQEKLEKTKSPPQLATTCCCNHLQPGFNQWVEYLEPSILCDLPHPMHLDLIAHIRSARSAAQRSNPDITEELATLRHRDVTQKVGAMTKWLTQPCCFPQFSFVPWFQNLGTWDPRPQSVVVILLIYKICASIRAQQALCGMTLLTLPCLPGAFGASTEQAGGAKSKGTKLIEVTAWIDFEQFLNIWDIIWYSFLSMYWCFDTYRNVECCSFWKSLAYLCISMRDLKGEEICYFRLATPFREIQSPEAAECEAALEEANTMEKKDTEASKGTQCTSI